MLKALILTGGKSTRMGKDKYLMQVHAGLPQYQYLYRLAGSVGLEAYISCSQEQLAEIGGDYRTIADHYEHIGPMGGIYAAMCAFPNDSWLVMACDLVNLRKDSLLRLIVSRDESFDAMTYLLPGQAFFETTITIYEPTLMPAVKQAIATGRYGLQSILKTCRLKVLLPLDESELKNANFPEDLIVS